MSFYKCIRDETELSDCFLPLGENNILQIMVRVVKGVRPDLAAVSRCRPSACAGFLSLMQCCWTTNPDARPSFQGKLCHFSSIIQTSHYETRVILTL